MLSLWYLGMLLLIGFSALRAHLQYELSALNALKRDPVLQDYSQLLAKQLSVDPKSRILSFKAKVSPAAFKWPPVHSRLNSEHTRLRADDCLYMSVIAWSFACVPAGRALTMSQAGMGALDGGTLGRIDGGLRHR